MKEFFQGRRRLGVLGGIAFVCTGLVLFFTFWPVPLRVVRWADFWYQDEVVMKLGRQAPVNEEMVFLAIDRPTLQLYQDEDPEIVDASHGLTLMSEPFPWSREVYALLIDRLCTAGVKLVVLDLFLQAPGDGDDELREVMDKWKDRVVVGSTLSQPETDQNIAEHKVPWTLNLPTDTVITQSSPVDLRTGYVNFFPDDDGIIRTVQLETTLGYLEGQNQIHAAEEWYQSITAASLRKLGRTEFLDRRLGARYFRFPAMHAHETYKPRSLYGILHPRIWEKNYHEGELLFGKVAFIGPSDPIFHDTHPTPLGEMLGPKLHMCALAAALSGDFYELSSIRRDIATVVGMGLAAFLICAFVGRPLLRLFLFVGAGLGFVAAGVFAYNHFDLMHTGVPPLAAYFSTGGICFGYDFARRVMEGLRLRRALERYVSKDLAKQILENREDYFSSLGGTSLPMTILFSDIRGFTTITEETPAAVLVPELNDFLGEMVDAVFTEKGTLDKFIGDAVMAVWGSVTTEGEQADAIRAVNAAVEMRDRAAKVNAGRVAEGKPPFKIGIGLNHGVAMFGNIGSVERMDPTVIGDPVNLAARLEGLTKTYRCDIIISGSVADHVRERFILRSVDRVKVKGKTKPVEIFSVLGRKREGRADPGWLDRYEEGLRAFHAREFERAAEIFEAVLEELPGDFLADHYLENSRGFIAEAPEESWDGVTTMTTK